MNIETFLPSSQNAESRDAVLSVSNAYQTTAAFGQVQELPIVHRYFRIQLRRKLLSEAGRARLERIGLECLSDGGCYEAYGVLKLDEHLILRIMQDQEVLTLECAEPPCCK